jgi:hypothetical protein
MCIRDRGDCVTDNISGVEYQSSVRNKGTSDLFEGHSVCALFLLNHVGSSNPWIQRDQDEILANTAVNLLWWTEQAALHGIEASFEIKPYLYNDPVCQISVDPTLSGLWTAEVMTKLGYSGSNIFESQMQYVEDLIEETQSDWGFIAFILRGTATYRSNANIFGPSTRITYLAARTGYTTAHEVGHIYGLQDEYEERAPIAYQYTLNGVANLNADFRNPVNAPCIMKATNPNAGICTYNSVHLHWADNVNLIEVVAYPEDALYTIDYLSGSGTPFLTGRYFQGKQAFPLGMNTKIRFNGLNQIQVPSGNYANPKWENGQKSITVSVADQSEQVFLEYLEDFESDNYTAYLKAGKEFTGKRFNRLYADDNGLYALSDQGISIYKDGELTVLDKIHYLPPSDSLIIFRMGRNITKTDNESILIAGREGTTFPIVLELLPNGNENFYKPPQNFREIGFYQAVVQSRDGRIFAAFETGGLHIYDLQGNMQILLERDGLPQDVVSALAIDNTGIIWLGFAKDRQGTGNGALFFLNPDNMSIYQSPAVPEQYKTLQIQKIKTYDEGKTMILISLDKFVVFRNNSWESFSLPVANIFDVDIIDEHRFVAGTNIGMFYQDQNQEWQQVTQQSHYLQENFCFSVLSLPNDIYLCGHNSVGITAIYTGERETSAIIAGSSVETSIKYFPNPFVSGSLTFNSSQPATGNVELSVFDLNGKLVFRSQISIADQNQFSFSIDEKINSGIYVMYLAGAIQGVPGLLYVD